MHPQPSALAGPVNASSRVNPRFADLSDRLAVINQFALLVLEARSVDELLWMIAKNAVAQLGFQDCVIYLKEKQTERLIQRAAHGPKNPVALDIYHPIVLEMGKGIVGHVALTGQAEIVNDTSTDPRYIVDDDARLSEISVPIIIGGAVIGIIDSEHPDANFYSLADLEILTTIASMSAAKLTQLDYEVQLNQLNDELREKNLALEKINHELDHFVYSVSHDLRAPLLSIKGIIENILEEGELDEHTREFLTLADVSASRLDGTIREILEYSRNSRLDVNYREFDVEELVRAAFNDLKFSVREEIGFTVRVHGDPLVSSDPARIGTLFKNIIGNSVKYRSKVRTAVILVDIHHDGKRMEVTVADNGQGIDAEHISRIFEMFFRATNSSYGTGLGLYICREIILKLKGNITAESVPGEGTVIRFSIPVGAPAAPTDVNP